VAMTTAPNAKCQRVLVLALCLVAACERPCGPYVANKCNLTQNVEFSAVMNLARQSCVGPCFRSVFSVIVAA